MTLNRRHMLAASGLAALAAAPARAADPAPAAPAAAAAAPKPSLGERLAAKVPECRHRLGFDGHAFSGPGWDLLVGEGRKAQFFMIGEEHGLAENARLAACLTEALAPAGYRRLVLEISPPMAQELDGALAAGGLEGLKSYYAAHQTMVAFYTMRQEAEFLAAARRVLPKGEQAIWGLDYEVGADRRLIERLKARSKPAAAVRALAALDAASAADWAEYRRTKNPGMIFSFHGDPELVARLRAAWPRPDAEADWILDTLQSTLEINRYWVNNDGWRSNQRRCELMRANFLRYWRAERARGRAPKALFKFGASHMTRGISLVEVLDVGTLIGEVGALEGGGAFNILVVGGPGANHAIFNPVDFRYDSGPVDVVEEEGLSPIVSATHGDGFSVVDLRQLRPLVTVNRAKTADPELVKVVHGFDALVVMPGATASANL